MRHETRFRMVERRDPARFVQLVEAAERAAKRRIAVYKQLAAITLPGDDPEGSSS